MSVPVSRPDQPNVFIDEIIVTESPIISLSYIIAKGRFSNQKLVNGSTLNSVTLG
jgi:hypothetical protein